MNKSKHNFDRQSRRIDSLTGARFLAIMIIVFSHFEFLKDYGSFGRTYWNWWHNATMGVDFFFIMSGFGMMLSSIRRDPSGSKPVGGLYGSLKFGIHHVKKIYSIYFTMLLIGIPYAVLLGIFEYGGNPITQIIKNVIYFFGDLTLLQATTGRASLSHSLNGVCWFLSSLFCIYLVSPFIMQWLKRHVKTVRTAIVGVVICIICSYLLAILFTNIDDKPWFFDDLCYGSPYRRVFYVFRGCCWHRFILSISRMNHIVCRCYFRPARLNIFLSDFQWCGFSGGISFRNLFGLHCGHDRSCL